MQTRHSLDSRRTVFTLAGLALLGLAPALPVNAQATPKPTDSVSHKDEAAQKEIARRTDYDVRDDEDYDPLIVDPAPMSYPQAAPGSLHLYHWTDYTRTKIAEGSPREEREARERLRDQRQRDRRERLNSMMGSYSPSAYGTSSGYDYTADTRGYSSDSRMSGRMNGTMYMGSSMMNWSPMAAAGDYVFLVRGNTLYKMNHSDLSIVTQKDLPMSQYGGSSSASSYSGSSSSGSYNGSAGSVSSSRSSISSSDRSSTNNSSGSNSNVNNTSGNNTSVNSSGTSSQNSPDSTTRTDTSRSNNTNSNSGADSTASGRNGSGLGQNSTSGGADTSGAGSANSSTGISSRRGNNRRSNSQNTGRNAGSSSMGYGGMYGGMMDTAPVSITASSDFVYVMRGNTLYQLRVSDLSLVSQKDLPSMYTGGQSGSQSSFYRSNTSSSQRTDATGTGRFNSNGTNSSNGNQSSRSDGGSGGNNPNGTPNRPE